MNLVKFEKFQAEPGWLLIKDFRQNDIKKLFLVVADMLSKLKNIRADFSYNMNIKDADASYSGGFAHKVGKLNIILSSGKFMNELNLEFPKLINDNLFILGGSTYIPILFLERAPIDRVGSKDTSKNKILLNLFTQQLDFDFKAKTVKLYKNFHVEMNVFFTALFYDKGYSSFMDEFYTEFGKPHLNNRLLTFKECKSRVLTALGITGHDRFKELEIDEFFNNFVMLNYTKETYQDFYGVSDIKDIVRIIYQYYKNDIDINMADIRNRRIVMTEYLMIPVFTFYQKILYNFIDSEYKEYLIPPLAGNSIIGDAFRKIMHGEQLFNITLPYITPLVHKISQNIVVIKNKIPKKWTSNHPSAMGVLCPISVSAQDMGQNLVATMQAQVNFYGRIKSFTFSEDSDIKIKLEPIELHGKSIHEDVVLQKGNFMVNEVTGEVTELTPEEIIVK